MEYRIFKEENNEHDTRGKKDKSKQNLRRTFYVNVKK